MSARGTCKHLHRAEPAPGKYLRVCLDCASRIIECSFCDAVAVAGPDIVDSGWTKGGQVSVTGSTTSYYCPNHG